MASGGRRGAFRAGRGPNPPPPSGRSKHPCPPVQPWWRPSSAAIVYSLYVSGSLVVASCCAMIATFFTLPGLPACAHRPFTLAVVTYCNTFFFHCPGTPRGWQSRSQACPVVNGSPAPSAVPVPLLCTHDGGHCCLRGMRPASTPGTRSYPYPPPPHPFPGRRQLLAQSLSMEHETRLLLWPCTPFGLVYAAGFSSPVSTGIAFIQPNPCERNSSSRIMLCRGVLLDCWELCLGV